MKFLIEGNMNIKESMEEYVPVTQTYFDVTKDTIIFYNATDPLNITAVGEVVNYASRLSDKIITWLNSHNIPLNIKPGTYCLEQPGNKLRKLED